MSKSKSAIKNILEAEQVLSQLPLWKSSLGVADTDVSKALEAFRNGYRPNNVEQDMVKDLVNAAREAYDTLCDILDHVQNMNRSANSMEVYLDDLHDRLVSLGYERDGFNEWSRTVPCKGFNVKLKIQEGLDSNSNYVGFVETFEGEKPWDMLEGVKSIVEIRRPKLDLLVTEIEKMAEMVRKMLEGEG